VKSSKGSRDNGLSETAKLLRGIWNETKAVKASLERQLTQTRQEFGKELAKTREDIGTRIDDTTKGLEGLRKDLTHRIVESEVRLATATTELSGDVRDLTTIVRDWRQEHRATTDTLNDRVSRIERHLSIERS
jgi:predicted  nucleic acid-binding Zn-ribbon protein